MGEVQARPVLALNPMQLQFMRALSRTAARNVVNEEPPTGATVQRVHVHEAKPTPYLKRKRVQPRGSMVCVGRPGIACDRQVSANKGRCAACTELFAEEEMRRLQTEEAVAGC